MKRFTHILALPRALVRVLAIGTLVLGAILGALYQRVDARAGLDTAQHADTIIVLGSSVYPGERASPSLSARIQRGVELYHAGYAPYLILCGGVGYNPPSEAEVMRRIAVRGGVPEQALVLEDQSRSTEENIRNAKALMDARGWTSALIVSAPYHLYRAEIIAQELGIKAYGSPARERAGFGAPWIRFLYTTREAVALVWYYATRVAAEPGWLHTLLIGRI